MDRRTQEEFFIANNSNGSDKSSLIGDYGGTSTLPKPQKYAPQTDIIR